MLPFWQVVVVVDVRIDDAFNRPEQLKQVFSVGFFRLKLIFLSFEVAVVVVADNEVSSNDPHKYM